MKKLLTFSSMLVICLGLYAQNADYMLKKDFQVEKKKIFESINGVKKSLSARYRLQDSLNQNQALLKAALARNSDSLNRQSATMKELQLSVEVTQEKANSFRVFFYIILLVSIALVLIVFFYFRLAMGRLKAELSQAVSVNKDKTDKEFEKINSVIVDQSEVFARHNDELRMKCTELSYALEKQQKDTLQHHQEYAGKIEDKFNTILHSAEMMDKSQKEAIHAIEEKLKTRWAATDAKLAEINAKLPK